MCHERRCVLKRFHIVCKALAIVAEPCRTSPTHPYSCRRKRFRISFIGNQRTINIIYRIIIRRYSFRISIDSRCTATAQDYHKSSCLSLSLSVFVAIVRNFHTDPGPFSLIIFRSVNFTSPQPSPHAPHIEYVFWFCRCRYVHPIGRCSSLLKEYKFRICYSAHDMNCSMQYACVFAECATDIFMCFFANVCDARNEASSYHVIASLQLLLFNRVFCRHVLNKSISFRRFCAKPSKSVSWINWNEKRIWAAAAAVSMPTYVTQ